MKQIAALMPALLIAACSTSSPPAPSTAAPQVITTAPTPAQSAPPPAENPAPIATTESPMEAFERMRSVLNKKSVYFDFDRDAIGPDADSLIAEHARLLHAYSNDHLTLQGNCDERGSSEYNLALGQRRANSVKRKLVLLGIPEGRIETVSFGKEKPRELCHQERCWAENRRADFVDSWKW